MFSISRCCQSPKVVGLIYVSVALTECVRVVLIIMNICFFFFFFFNSSHSGGCRVILHFFFKFLKKFL